MRDFGERGEIVPVAVGEADPGDRDQTRVRGVSAARKTSGVMRSRGVRDEANVDAELAATRATATRSNRTRYRAEHDFVARLPVEPARDDVGAVAGVAQERDLVAARRR